MSQIKRFSEPRALCKKERQRWSNFSKFFSSNHHGRGLRTSVSRIFFFGDNFFLHVGGIFSWSFWLFWLGLGCIVRHTYITLLIQCLCVMSSARRFWREDVIAHRFPGNFCAANSYFFLLSWNILDFPSFFSCLDWQRRSNSHDKCWDQ